jgi:hypothetical protein
MDNDMNFSEHDLEARRVREAHERGVERLKTQVVELTGMLDDAVELINVLGNIAAQMQAVPTQTWLPIKTAPRDGTNILLRFGSDGASQGQYIPGLPRPWKFIDMNDKITWLINHAVDGPGGPSHWQPMPN